MWENTTQEAERRNKKITDKVIFFGPLRIKSVLLTLSLRTK